jgi:hypothetical protein
LTLGYYDTFPENIHYMDHFQSFVSIRQLQQKLLQFIGDINRKEFAFEQVSIPTIPDGVVIFEFGLAEDAGFNYLNPPEVTRALDFVGQEQVKTLDFFCSIRYYRGIGENRVAQKFDYYMLRSVYGKSSLELHVFHERGPRYLSPEDIAVFIMKGVNGDSNKKILRETNP